MKVMKVLLISFQLNGIFLEPHEVYWATFVMLKVILFLDTKFKGKSVSLFGLKLTFCFDSNLFQNQPA